MNPCREPYCPQFHHAIELIGRRWTGAVLLAMVAGRRHFGEIRDAVPGLSDRLLTERLKELETEGIVTRSVEGRSVSYGLTERGLGLVPILDAVSDYASRWGRAATSPVGS